VNELARGVLAVREELANISGGIGWNYLVDELLFNNIHFIVAATILELEVKFVVLTVG